MKDLGWAQRKGDTDPTCQGEEGALVVVHPSGLH